MDEPTFLEMPLLYRLSLSCPLTCTDTSKAVSTGMKKVWAPLTLNIWVRLFENQHFQCYSHLEYETHDQSGCYLLRSAAPWNTRMWFPSRLYRVDFARSFCASKLTKNSDWRRVMGIRGSRTESITCRTYQEVCFWKIWDKIKKFEALWIRTCSSPLADRPGISGATISAWFTKIPVPLSKLEPDPSNGEYANLNIGWEKLKIYNAMLPCVTSLDSALGSDQSTYLACAWIPIAVVLRWLMMLASDLVDILRILPHSSCGSIPSSRDLPPPKNDSALKPSPV